VSYVGDAVFSVIVPTRRRPRQLSRCLGALAHLDYSREFEVVVAADGGDDPSRDVVERFRSRLNVHLVEASLRGPAAARNAGADRALGTYLAFTDDDCAPDARWLTELERKLSSNPDSLVGGRVVNGVEGNLYAETSQLVVDAVYAYYRAGEVGSFFTSNNLAIRAAAFREMGGFDASFPFAAGEDRDFGDRCAAEGLELQHAVGAVVRHFHDLTLRSFLRQHFTYGRGAAHFRRARLRRGLGVVTVSPGFYSTLLRLPVSRHGVRGVSLAGLAALSQIVYAAGFAREEAAGRRP
jgi:GT2 family glycosyltransferase